MTSPPVLAEDLTKSFGSRRGITGVSLVVEQGQVFGFLGPNGAGKSTTIRCLLGLYRPTSGRVRTLGRDPTHGAAGYLREVGYLPGELRLPEALTGADVFARFGRMRGAADTAYRDELVERLGVETDRPIRSLSKGNKQKVGIVLALMHRPRLLVLDEPTSGLDPLQQDEFATLVREHAADGGTVLLSSHDLDEVQRVAGRVAIIREGRIVADDTVTALRADAPDTMELTFDHDVDAGPLTELAGITVLASGPRRITLTYTGPAAPVLAVVARLAPESLTAHPADLDELFRRLYDDAPTPGGRP
ncbi:ABC transporter ATP-binding protein [Intrasporangium sp.]|uniref:ABC transporter ATP-binding protein n=1 Tax=Intrasporangium sp. TaxID=1925024 RepID=UPI0032216D2E